jgi:hypothetical protein
MSTANASPGNKYSKAINVGCKPGSTPDMSGSPAGGAILRLYRKTGRRKNMGSQSHDVCESWSEGFVSNGLFVACHGPPQGVIGFNCRKEINDCTWKHPCIPLVHRKHLLLCVYLHLVCGCSILRPFLPVLFLPASVTLPIVTPQVLS